MILTGSQSSCRHPLAPPAGQASQHDGNHDLLSDLSTGVTDEIHYVDSGYNIISLPRPEDLKGE